MSPPPLTTASPPQPARAPQPSAECSVLPPMCVAAMPARGGEARGWQHQVPACVGWQPSGRSTGPPPPRARPPCAPCGVPGAGLTAEWGGDVAGKQRGRMLTGGCGTATLLLNHTTYIALYCSTLQYSAVHCVPVAAVTATLLLNADPNSWRRASIMWFRRKDFPVPASPARAAEGRGGVRGGLWDPGLPPPPAPAIPSPGRPLAPRCPSPAHPPHPPTSPPTLPSGPSPPKPHPPPLQAHPAKGPPTSEEHRLPAAHQLQHRRLLLRQHRAVGLAAAAGVVVWVGAASRLAVAKCMGGGSGRGPGGGGPRALRAGTVCTVGGRAGTPGTASRAHPAAPGCLLPPGWR